MRAPGKVSASPVLPGLREAIAVSSPVREPATPPANALAIPPGPMMPQRIFLFAEVIVQSPSGCWAGQLGTSADARAGAVEEERALGLDRDGKVVAAAAVP